MKTHFILMLLFLTSFQLYTMDSSEAYIDDADVGRDSEQIVKLFQNDIDFLFHTSDQFSPETIRWEIEHKRVSSIWPVKEEDYEPPFYQKVLRKNEDLIGVISYIIATDSGRLKKTFGEQGKECWLWQLCVDSSFRRNGYGQRMLESSLVHLKMLDVETVGVFVRDYNSPCISLCKKLGFEHYKTMSEYQSLLFRKKL